MMLMKIKQLLKFLGNLFSKKEIPEAKPVKKVHKHIQEMKDLQIELVATENGFNKAIAEKVQEYDAANYEYGLAYMDFAELHKKHRLGLVKESVITDEKAKLKPLEDAVNDVGEELDTIQRYKKEETINILDQFGDLQEDYILAKVSEVNAIASELDQMKLDYQQKFMEYVAGCQEVFNVEKDMMHQLQQHGFMNKPVMGDRFSSMMGDMPTPFEN